jgi:hypothetical protein
MVNEPDIRDFLTSKLMPILKKNDPIYIRIYPSDNRYISDDTRLIRYQIIWF